MSARPPTPPVKITLIGLDRVGGSLGLALRERKTIRVTGFDRDGDLARLAASRGLVHDARWDLPEAVSGADLVLLGGPLADQAEHLRTMAPALREAAVVACLGPLLAPPLAWGQAHLPARRHVVAAHPILNPAYLHDGALGLDAARADLFARGLWALAAGPEAAPEAVKLLSDLAALLGAQPHFMDPAEHDGLMGALDGLPVLTALALLRAADASPGWAEMRKVADRGFATATFALNTADPAALSLNRDNVLRYLDAALAELQAVRDQLARGDQAALAMALAEAAERRAKWAAEREQGEWEAAEQDRPELPTFGDLLGRAFTGGLFQKRDKK